MTSVQADRWLAPLSVDGRGAAIVTATAALRAALDGSGPALVPMPVGPGGASVAAMARTGLPLEAIADGEHIALVVPTSGSTGEPKGALLTASALRASATSTLDRLGGPGQWLLALPLSHIAGLQVVIRSLVSGVQPVAMAPSDGFDPAGFAAATAELDRARRYTALVPTQLRRLLDGPSSAREALATYDAVLVGGAALDHRLRSRAVEAGVRVVTTYGMSETCGGCVYDGVALDGVRVEAPHDGPVLLGGPVVFHGYRLRPDLTAAALTVVDGMRWHVTADLGRVDGDGRLHVTGRLDDMIVTGGEKVAPAQVEAVLSSHPGVREVVVLGQADPAWGQRVVAVVVPADHAAIPGLESLCEHATPTLPAYALPKRVVGLTEIPLLPSGKPDRAALRRLLERPA